MSQDKLEILTKEVTLKLLSGQALANGVASPTAKDVPEPSSRVAVIKVFDSLVSKGGAGESGFTSYESIQKASLAAIENGASKIGYYVDSPGGEAFGMAPLAHFIASIPQVYGVETFAFTDGIAHSAAYGIFSAAQRTYAVPSSSLGSIGTLLTLVDDSKAIENSDRNYIIMRSKPEKAIGNPIEGYSPEALAKYEAILEEMDSIFNNIVAENRPVLSIQDIIDMKGSTFMAQKALELKLVDKLVPTFNDVLQLETKSKPTKSRGVTMTLEECKAKLEAAEAELKELRASSTQIAVKAIADERARCLDILEAASTLKISNQEQVTKRIKAGTSKEDTLDIFTAIAEAVGVASAIDTTASAVQSTVLPETKGKPLQLEGYEDLSSSDILAAAQQLSKGVK